MPCSWIVVLRSVGSIVLAFVPLVACSGGGGDDGGERVAIDDFFDLEQDLPDDVSGLDLGEDGPATDASFCTAWGSAPARWFDDAVVPLQYAVDAWRPGRDDVPAEVLGDYDLLLAFGDAKIEWNFKQRDERPIWSSTEAAAALAVADAAVDNCDDLPLVATFAAPEQTRAVGTCDEDAADVRIGVTWYLAERGEPPRHQQQIERLSDLRYHEGYEATGELDLDDYYFASDVHGVAPDGSGDVIPVPGGPCDT